MTINILSLSQGHAPVNWDLLFMASVDSSADLRELWNSSSAKEGLIIYPFHLALVNMTEFMSHRAVTWDHIRYVRMNCDLGNNNIYCDTDTKETTESI